AADGSAEAARALLEVAAVGLDERVDYSATMVPSLVRGIGERHLATLQDPAAVALLVAAAGGEAGGPRTHATAVQAAALHALGARQDPGHTDLLAAALGSDAVSLRRAAARALGKFGRPRAVAPLAARLATESEGTVVIELVRGLDALLSGRVAGPQLGDDFEAAVFA